MIERGQLVEIGQFNKPHGIKGEISATFFVDIDPGELRCVIVDRDNIPVPFFITSSRHRQADTYLVKIEGFDDEKGVKTLANAPIYGLTGDAAVAEAMDDECAGGEDGVYAADLIGYFIEDSGRRIGEVVDIDDSTANTLFVVDTPDRGEIFIPVAPEMIIAVDTDRGIIEMNLPSGLPGLD